MENPKPNNKVVIYLLIGFFVVFVGSGAMLMSDTKSAANKKSVVNNSTIKQQVMEIPTPMPTKGSLVLSSESIQDSVGDTIILTVTADSLGENITAYDVIVKYDPLAFDFVKGTSLDPQFQVYSFKDESQIIMTVVKTTQSKTTSVFTEKPVLNLSFQAKKAGEHAFSILPTYNKDSTKFVNEKTEVINPETGDIKVVIE